MHSFEMFPCNSILSVYIIYVYQHYKVRTCALWTGGLVVMLHGTQYPVLNIGLGKGEVEKTIIWKYGNNNEYRD